MFTYTYVIVQPVCLATCSHCVAACTRGRDVTSAGDGSQSTEQLCCVRQRHLSVKFLFVKRSKLRTRTKVNEAPLPPIHRKLYKTSVFASRFGDDVRFSRFADYLDMLHKEGNEVVLGHVSEMPHQSFGFRGLSVRVRRVAACVPGLLLGGFTRAHSYVVKSAVKLCAAIHERP